MKVFIDNEEEEELDEIAQIGQLNYEYECEYEYLMGRSKEADYEDIMDQLEKVEIEQRKLRRQRSIVNVNKNKFKRK
jgi:hypothetical protein